MCIQGKFVLQSSVISQVTFSTVVSAAASLEELSGLSWRNSAL